MQSKVPRRKTVSSKIYAIATYPKLGSLKEGTSKFINIVISDDEALNLARHLVQAAREAKEVTVLCLRTPAVKSGLHQITVTYDTRKAKKNI